MRSFPKVVLGKMLLVGLVPLLMASVVTLLTVVRHGVLDAGREARIEASRSKLVLDHTTRMVERRWIRTFDANFRHPSADSADHRTLEAAIDGDSGVCLASLWRGDSLEYSHPRRDEIPPADLLPGGWSDVETHPRCTGPVVRFAFRLDSLRTGTVAFRLDPLWRELIGPTRGSESRTSILDRHGAVVGNVESMRGDIPQSDPLLSQVQEDSLQANGWRLEPEGLFSFSTRKLAGPPWWVVVRQDVPSTLAPLAPLGLVVIGSLLVAAWLAFILARGSTALVVEPLVQLRNSLAALEEGEFEGDLVAGDIEEIHQLANTYNRMAQAIHRRESQRLRELETMVAELESFSYSVSHDLRAPLRAIHGFARILLEEHSAHLPPEGSESLERIRAAALRMGMLIDDLLRLAQAARTQLRKVPIQLDSLVAELASELVADRETSPIEWSRESLGTAYGDPGLIRQVWENLLSNAIKYSRKNPAPRIRIWRETNADGSTWWWVQDNGIGFEPELASKLFGVFQRLHSQSQFEGTGIGLALVKRIVDRHGGKVHAEGSPGHGARFGFSLPQSD